ncbi:MAG: hypothetical protein M0P42_16390, partial [Gallionella sp.]|nr:hypothetical protein [Gallionella sp.]
FRLAAFSQYHLPIAAHRARTHRSCFRPSAAIDSNRHRIDFDVRGRAVSCFIRTFSTNAHADAKIQKVLAKSKAHH